VRRVLAFVVVLSIGTLGLGLLSSSAQSEPLVRIGVDEKPIAESKARIQPVRQTSFETSSIEPMETPKNEPKKLESAIIRTDIAQNVKPVESPKIDLAPLDQIPASKTNPTSNSVQIQLPPTLELPPVQEPQKNESNTIDPLPLSVPPTTPKTEEKSLPRELPKELPKSSEVLKVPASNKASTNPQAESRTPIANGNKGIVPSLSVEVIVPESVRLGQQLSYEIVVRNPSNILANQIRIEDVLPKSMTYISSEPQAEVLGERISWSIGSIEPSGEKRIQVALKPIAEGDWKSKPVVTFSAQMQPIQIKVTAPKLTVSAVTDNEVVYIGEEVPFHIEIKNEGNGVANQVLLRAQLSDGLHHPQAKEEHGRVIEAELPNLGPGETKRITLKTDVLRSGSNGLAVSTSTENCSDASGKVVVQAVPAPLTLKMSGPQRGLVRSEPTFQFEITNSSNQQSQTVQIAAAFPEGLDFVSASDNGEYDSENRVIRWILKPLNANQRISTSVKTRVMTTGNFAIRAVAQAGPRMKVKTETIIQTDGVPGLSFALVNKDNPVEMGKETCYEIRLVNQGTTPCSNIRISTSMSEGLTPISVVSSTGEVGHKINGQIVTLDPIGKLAIQGEMIIRIKAKGTQAGDQRCRVQIVCDQLKQPVIKEESTFFFAP
jgi:uncharacterized repeat protein (TIGR01451 family)